MSRAAQTQARLFRGQGGKDKDVTPPTTTDPNDPNALSSRVNSLNIAIPKPPTMVNTSHTEQAQQRKLNKPSTTDPSPKATPSSAAAAAAAASTTAAPPDGRPYRERLIEKLGHRYNGVEKFRLQQDEKRERHWKRWGPYVSERQWATVREDYSADGDAWSHFPHEHARSRAYRWGEDGLAGISDNHSNLCFSVALWNTKDSILKERMFGVTGHQGNHGEDCKELYYYLDSTPTHSYMKHLYKYPQREYPYEQLVRESGNRSRDVPEYEILDTDAFDEDRYWDVFTEYAKDEDDPDSISIRITAYNRGPDAATLHIVPQIWFRNTWSWPIEPPAKPSLHAAGENVIKIAHPTLGKSNLYCMSSPPPVGPGDDTEFDDDAGVEPELLFTENDTNFQRLYGGKNQVPWAKDAFHDHIIPAHRPAKDSDAGSGFFSGKVHSRQYTSADDDEVEYGPRTPFPAEDSFVNPERKGTKAAAHYVFENVPGNGGVAVVRLKMTPKSASRDPAVEDEGVFDDVVDERREEADEFYSSLVLGPITDDLKQIMRQGLAGMMWTKQYYEFIQKPWAEGDPAQPPPPPQRKYVRNKEWKHMHAADILSMPDKWEYPFFAAWDTAFHCIPLAVVDPAFAKKQLDVLTREWYMKPDGQIPAYEWNFSDVNPPVHAWATFRVFKIERKLTGQEDLAFLERVFQKLLLNFTWWVNRKDQDGNNIFEGGFLGLDNIGVFNRSEPLPTGGTLRQADGTAWMAFYSLNMLNIALELAKHNPVYEDIASKFFEHFIFIADAMTFKGDGDNEMSLWNEQDGLYYDAIQFDGGHSMHLPVRSLVGLIPLYATLVLEPSVIKRFPGFSKRMQWFMDNRSEMSSRNMANMKVGGRGERRLLALASEERLVSILQKMLDENEFLSEHGIRSLSKLHKEHPWGMDVHGERHEVNYWPGDSRSGMFGGNSNWRGPIWLAVNFLLIESLQRFYQYYGDKVTVECPTGSGERMNLLEVAEEIQHRIIHIFARDTDNRRATNGGDDRLDFDPNFRDYTWFYEFFDGDSGRGLGASHQTGWSGLVAYHILQSGATCRLPKTPKTPRGVAQHYFDEEIGGKSAYAETPYSARSAYDLNTLGDVSPNAL